VACPPSIREKAGIQEPPPVVLESCDIRNPISGLAFPPIAPLDAPVIESLREKVKDLGAPLDERRAERLDSAHAAVAHAIEQVGERSLGALFTLCPIEAIDRLLDLVEPAAWDDG
jgi:hypothetical protein